MHRMACSIMKIKQGMVLRYRQTGLVVALAALLISSLAPAQTGPNSQQPQKPSPTPTPATPGGAAEAAASTSYVDGGSSCLFRTGDKDCQDPLSGTGPYRQMGEGFRGVSQNGTLFLRAGTYGEAIFLNKAMVIRAYDGAATISPSPLAPFDLVVDAVDDNWLPLNPKWRGGTEKPDPLQCPPGRGMAHDPGSPPCSNQFTHLNDAHICGPHINWFGATYTGTIQWANHSCPAGGPPIDCGDDDYNMRLLTKNMEGYVNDGRNSILCEFDSDETIDHFSTPWWSLFHATVDIGGCHSGNEFASCVPHGADDSGAQAMIGKNGSYAIVTGLMGLDTEHNIHVELHPVWALAMNVPPFSVDNDLWVFFVRNWGNEGFCGNDQEFIDFPNNQYTFRLPWKPGAMDVSVANQFWHVYPDGTQQPPPTVCKVTGQAVFVRFNLDAPRDDGSMWDGELHLQWLGQGVAIPACAQPLSSPQNGEKPSLREFPKSNPRSESSRKG